MSQSLWMELPPRIDRVLELGEAIYRHYLHVPRHGVLAPDTVPPPAPEEAMLRAHLQSLSAGDIYLVLVALEIGLGDLHPVYLMEAVVAASDAFPRPIDAVECLMEESIHLANYLESGFLCLHERGVDLMRLFQRIPVNEDPFDG